MKKNKTRKKVINEIANRKCGETYLPTGELYTFIKNIFIS